MYGGMWTNAQGDEPNETWWLGLRDLKPEQIKRGIESLRDSAKPFPPSLPELFSHLGSIRLGALNLVGKRCCKERIDTAIEKEYVENGGVLHYVLRNLAKAS